MMTDTTSKQVPLYTVEADRETGLWLTEPKRVGLVCLAEWHMKPDTDEAHFDTYEEPVPGGVGTTTRAIEVLWR